MRPGQQETYSDDFSTNPLSIHKAQQHSNQRHLGSSISLYATKYDIQRKYGPSEVINDVPLERSSRRRTQIRGTNNISEHHCVHKLRLFIYHHQ